MKQKIAIFLSGGGSNARNICEYFNKNECVEVALLLSNKEQSGAKAIGVDYGIPYYVFSRAEFYETGNIVQKLKELKVDAVVLAGFLWLLPSDLLDAFPNKIINIHPALLPKYGGKGMHGAHVHEAVFSNQEKETGITIHLCNEKYDEGKILYQHKVALDENDSPETIAKKVLNAEHEWYPRIIEQFLTTS